MNIGKNSHFSSSHQTCSMNKGVPRNFTKFTGKKAAREPLLKKLQAWGMQLYQKRDWHRCFSVNFAKFLRTPFLQNTSGRLLFSFNQQHFFFTRGVDKYKNTSLSQLYQPKRTPFSPYTLSLTTFVSYIHMNIAKFLRTAIL